MVIIFVFPHQITHFGIKKSSANQTEKILQFL